jgi:hypothetical protein
MSGALARGQVSLLVEAMFYSDALVNLKEASSFISRFLPKTAVFNWSTLEETLFPILRTESPGISLVERCQF